MVDGEDITQRRGLLPPGDYLCRWLVDGDEVGEKRCSVSEEPGGQTSWRDR